MVGQLAVMLNGLRTNSTNDMLVVNQTESEMLKCCKQIKNQHLTALCPQYCLDVEF